MGFRSIFGAAKSTEELLKEKIKAQQEVPDSGRAGLFNKITEAGDLKSGLKSALGVATPSPPGGAFASKGMAPMMEAIQEKFKQQKLETDAKLKSERDRAKAEQDKIKALAQQKKTAIEDKKKTTTSERKTPLQKEATAYGKKRAGSTYDYKAGAGYKKKLVAKHAKRYTARKEFEAKETGVSL